MKNKSFQSTAKGHSPDLDSRSFPREQAPFWSVLITVTSWQRRARVLTQIAEGNRQEDQTMQQAQQGDQEVEAEEEDLDELGMGKAQDEDAWEVGHSHSSKHLGGVWGCGVLVRSPAGQKGQVEHRMTHPSPLTALPMEAVASLALSSRVGLVLIAKDRVMWDTNSTDMPTAYRRRAELQLTR